RGRPAAPRTPASRARPCMWRSLPRNAISTTDISPPLLRAPLRRGLCRVLLLGEPVAAGAVVLAAPARGVEARRLAAQRSTGVAEAVDRARECRCQRAAWSLSSWQGCALPREEDGLSAHHFQLGLFGARVTLANAAPGLHLGHRRPVEERSGAGYVSEVPVVGLAVGPEELGRADHIGVGDGHVRADRGAA